MTEPTNEVTNQQPELHAAVIEIVERQFTGERMPYTGVESLLRPNHLRIDGVAVYATEDAPVTIHEIVIDGDVLAPPFAVTVSLFARAIRVGETPTFDAGALGGAGSTSGAVVEIPDVDELEPGGQVDRPYVLLNGKPVFITGDIRVGELSTSWRNWHMAKVTLTLPCRRLVVDDELCEPAAKTATP